MIIDHIRKTNRNERQEACYITDHGREYVRYVSKWLVLLYKVMMNGGNEHE